MVLDLADLHSLAPNLDLAVSPSHIRERAIVVLPHQVACAIHAAHASRGARQNGRRLQPILGQPDRIGNERARGFLWIVEVAACEERPLNEQLPNNTDRHQAIAVGFVHDPQAAC